ncbi:MAG: hypothetical protein A2W22_04810 [Candidatus Levybacteria bacterium RBG_16_35_11]|nr:MAG: hypothetical protein A2W22_04810 [Candidatus Levybacteria bacterium RBG_16_35_11]
MLDANLLKIEPKLEIKLGNSKRVGILNRGRNTKIINNTFSDLDTGIQDEGENTLAVGNKIS